MFPMHGTRGHSKFDRLLVYSTPAGFTEEISSTGRLLGNLLQAFIHLATINAADGLHEALDPPSAAGSTQADACDRRARSVFGDDDRNMADAHGRRHQRSDGDPFEVRLE